MLIHTYLYIHTPTHTGLVLRTPILRAEPGKSICAYEHTCNTHTFTQVHRCMLTHMPTAPSPGYAFSNTCSYTCLPLAPCMAELEARKGENVLAGMGWASTLLLWQRPGKKENK